MWQGFFRHIFGHQLSPILSEMKLWNYSNDSLWAILIQISKYNVDNLKRLWYGNRSILARNVSKEAYYAYFQWIDLNRLRRYRALEFRQPVTQGKHSMKRSLYKALHKRLSLVLRRWRPARSYRPFLKHQRFAVWSLLLFKLHSVQYSDLWFCFATSFWVLFGGSYYFLGKRGWLH